MTIGPLYYYFFFFFFPSSLRCPSNFYQRRVRSLFPCFIEKYRGKGKRSVTNGDASFFSNSKASSEYEHREKEIGGIRVYNRYIRSIQSNQILQIRIREKDFARDFLIRDKNEINENILRESCLSA